MPEIGGESGVVFFLPTKGTNFHEIREDYNMRLTNDIRDRIVENVLKQSPAQKAYDEACVAVEELLEEFRVVALGFSEKRLLALEKRIQKALKPFQGSPIVPKFELKRCTRFMDFRFHNGGNTRQARKDDSRLGTYDTMQLPDGDYRDRYEKAHNLEKKTREALKLLRREVVSTVYGVTTIKKLVDSWPEVKPFIPTDSAFKSVALVVCREDLNKKLGIEAA